MTATDAIIEAARPYASPLGNISALHLLDQGGFDCAFTMLWINNGQNQPPKGTDQKFSPTLLLGQSATQTCVYFAVTGSTLEPGDEVWMYVTVYGGTANDSPLRFTYQLNSPTAEFTISGTTTSNKLGFNGFS